MSFKKSAFVSKKCIIARTLGCAAISFPLILAACGDDKSSSANDGDETAEDFMFTLEELEEMGVPIFESADDLKKEKCTEENEFETVYVKVDSSFYMCDNGKWDNDFSSDNFTIEIPVVDSKDDLGECGEENDGEMFRVPRDTIFDTYACEDGEWVSDFGGYGDFVDPETVVRGSFKDERDGKTYKTVKIGDLTWMAENLNYELDGSRCYDDNPDKCKKYGRLYDYKSVEKTCPAGWKVPIRRESNKLLASIADHSRPEMGYDPYGFNVLLGGSAVGIKTIKYEEEGEKTAYWLSLNNPVWSAFKISEYYPLYTTSTGDQPKRWAYIRCVKN